VLDYKITISPPEIAGQFREIDQARPHGPSDFFRYSLESLQDAGQHLLKCGEKPVVTISKVSGKRGSLLDEGQHQISCSRRISGGTLVLTDHALRFGDLYLCTLAKRIREQTVRDELPIQRKLLARLAEPRGTSGSPWISGRVRRSS
jgi:hypothetical protein